jgi:hypothetical protein
MVFSIYDSTEDAIKKMIAANERTMNLGGGDGAALATATRRLRKLQISTLRGAPRDSKQLEWLIRRKEREKKDAQYIWDTERLMAEIEMLKVVEYLVNRKMDNNNSSQTR